jgi:hypothetical protein
LLLPVERCPLVKITIKRGQSLGRIAEYHHVPTRAIIAANQLLEVIQKLQVRHGHRSDPENYRRGYSLGPQHVSSRAR